MKTYTEAEVMAMVSKMENETLHFALKAVKLLGEDGAMAFLEKCIDRLEDGEG